MSDNLNNQAVSLIDSFLMCFLNDLALLRPTYFALLLTTFWTSRSGGPIVEITTNEIVSQPEGGGGIFASSTKKSF